MSEPIRLPYPGLRPFRRDETDLFFGRESCVDAMVGRLAETHFLAVLGASGSGKSSLVRTGLLDALELGLMAGAGPRWLIADLRPGGQPIENLARALLAPEGRAAPDVSGPDTAALASQLRRGPQAVIRWCREGNLPERTNLLILADQFEELFRYADYAGREEAERFVALLLESAAAERPPIYVVLTMRSEFLGPCALFPDLAERINAGLYLVRRMTREEMREAIEGPAGVCGFSIERPLVNRLLNDLASFAPWEGEHGVDQIQLLARRADQLPLLQHVLNRLWLRAREATPEAAVTLRLADYEALGGLSGALNGHADEVLAAIGREHKAVAEHVFRALVSGSTIASAVRRPCRFDELVALGGGDRAAVERVVEAFRGPDCSFLVTSREGALTDETMVDISHESLIRQWQTLSAWAQAEAKAGEDYRLLEERAARWGEGHAALLSGPDLGSELAWWRREQPSEAWARRYGTRFAVVRRFLDRSEGREKRRRFAARAAACAAIVVVVIGGVLVTRQEMQLHRFREATIAYNAGDLYDTGRGGEQSNTKAIAAFQKALSLGNSDAERRIAEIRFREKHYDAALAAYQDYVARVRESPASERPGTNTQTVLAGAGTRIANISYDLVMAGEFQPGLEGATLAARLAPNAMWIEGIRADALMMLGKTEEARAMYLRYEGLKDDGSGSSWKQDVLDDFDELRRKGYSKPLMAEIEAAFRGTTGEADPKASAGKSP